MLLNREQVNKILNDRPAGTDKYKILDGLIERGYDIEGVDSNARRQQLVSQKQVTQEQKPLTLADRAKEAFGDIKQIGTDIVDNSIKRGENIKEIKTAFKEGEQTDTRSALQTAGQLAGAGADAIGAVFKGAGNILLSDKNEKDVTDVIQKFGAKVMAVPEVQSIINKYNELPETQQRDIDAAGGLVSLVANFVGGAGATEAKNLATQATKNAVNKIDDVATTAIKDVATAIPKPKDAFVQFISPNVDDTVKKVLQKTDTDKFDNIVRIATEAAEDATKPSVYETVAESLTNATKQLQNQTKSLSQQKSTIIGKAKTGLTDFTKETGQTILAINRKLKDNPTADSFINRLKQVKTKTDADKAIDELQDILYKGNKDMTIPAGSSEDKVLRGLLGEYNTNLKSSLPSSYGKINTDISNRIKAINILNRALGETVDGVSTRGAGLVKQFFSPAGTKTKELFKFIKDNTGVDLAQDAILAKYVGEAFGDTRIKSLLEGVPTSKTGAIDKIIDFTLEKTGTNKALENAKREGILKKARSITDDTKSSNGLKEMGETPKQLDPLLTREAKKYKSAEEFVKAQGTPVYRGEGGSNVAQGKALLAEGKHFASDADYPKGFGSVGEYVLKPKAKVLDLGDSTFAEISQKLGIPERRYISPKELSAISKEKGYDVLQYKGEYKSTGKQFTHTVDLTGDSYVSKSQLTDIWKKANNIKK